MKKISTLLGAVAAVAAISAPAFAADMRMPVKAPPPIAAPIFSWTGCYIGGNVGAVHGESRFDWGGIAEGATAFAAGAATVLPAAANATLKDTNFTGGGQIGCNYQTGVFVFGGEADINYTGLSASRDVISLGNTNGGPATIVPGLITQSMTSDWLATIRARLGFASGTWLFYATGGLAIADASFNDQVCFPTAAVPTCNTASISDTRFGWTVGGGIEWAFAPKWSVKAEYLYADLGDEATTSIARTAAGATPFVNATIIHNHDLREHIGRVGINYRF